MQELTQFANDRPTALNDDLYQWAADAEDHIRSLAAELNTSNEDLAKHRELMLSHLAIIDPLRAERDKYQKLLMRWCNDSMDTAQVKQLETETISAIKGTQ